MREVIPHFLPIEGYLALTFARTLAFSCVTLVSAYHFKMPPLRKKLPNKTLQSPSKYALLFSEVPSRIYDEIQGRIVHELRQVGSEKTLGLSNEKILLRSYLCSAVS
jgi:hypothetical protein